jgi:malonyl-CoA decarboxylase
VDLGRRHLLALLFSGSLLRLERLTWEASSDALRVSAAGRGALRDAVAPGCPLSVPVPTANPPHNPGRSQVRLERASVHPAAGPADLRRRMAGAGRCFGLLHPALPTDAPLTVLQVALCREEPADMAAVLGDGGGRPGALGAGGGAAESSGGSVAAESSGSGSGSSSGGPGSSSGGGPDAAAVACFYSIYSTQPGLSGLDLGRTTILRAATALLAEAAAAGRPPPRLVTLSPVPGFRAWLEARLRAAAAAGAGEQQQAPLLRGEEVSLLLRHAGGAPGSGARGGGSTTGQYAAAAAALLELLATWRGPGAAPPDETALLRPLLGRLAAGYLLRANAPGGGGGGRGALDPVANFHLSNGASLWRVNFGCEPAQRGSCAAAAGRPPLTLSARRMWAAFRPSITTPCALGTPPPGPTNRPRRCGRALV